MKTRGGGENIECMAKTSPPFWEHFAHDADIGIRGVGRTLNEAFEQGALALTAICTNPSGVMSRDSIVVTCSAPDPELLFVDWLNAVVYQMATQHELFGRFEVSTDGRQLTGTLFGESVDVDRHQPAAEVKGATYTALRVKQDNAGQWVAECVVDV